MSSVQGSAAQHAHIHDLVHCLGFSFFLSLYDCGIQSRQTPERNDVIVRTPGPAVFSPCYRISGLVLAGFGSTDTTPDQRFLFRRAVQPAATTRRTATRKRSEENINHLYRACCCFCRAASLLSLWLSAVWKTFTLPAWLRMRTGRRSVSRSVRRRVPCDTSAHRGQQSSNLSICSPTWPLLAHTVDQIKM